MSPFLFHNTPQPWAFSSVVCWGGSHRNKLLLGPTLETLTHGLQGNDRIEQDHPVEEVKLTRHWQKIMPTAINLLGRHMRELDDNLTSLGDKLLSKTLLLGGPPRPNLRGILRGTRAPVESVPWTVRLAYGDQLWIHCLGWNYVRQRYSSQCLLCPSRGWW